jgi:fumarylacetoacetate (FAA) hydrolase
MAAPDGTWLDLAALAGRPFRALEDALPLLAAQGPAWRARAAAWHGPRFRLGEFHFLAPVVRPPSFRDFYAFEQHVKTARAARGLAMVPAWYEIPVFYFSNPGALVGHDAAVSAPAGCAELDYELELGVVIGRGGKNIPTAQAWEHIAGLTVLNDFSARDLQREEMTVGLGPAKAKDFATGAGPWLTTRDDVADRLTGETLALAMIARVNGRELSRGNAASLHHSIPQLVAQASRDAELFPGDLLGTGTVGTGCILELRPENTGGWLQPGDVVELEIERLGVLRHRIVARPA